MDWSEGKELFKSLYQTVFEKNAKQSWVQVWVVAEKWLSFQYIKDRSFLQYSKSNPNSQLRTNSKVPRGLTVTLSKRLHP